VSDSALQLSAAPVALIDEGLSGARLRGGGSQPDAVWRAKLRDDDGRVWRAIAADPASLAAAWVPAKSSTGHLAALASLRPVEIELRVELPDGRAVSRTVTRRLVADGVRVRRWRDDLVATLYRPAGDGPHPAVVLDATGGGEAVAVATLAGALLASRGVLGLAVAPPARPRDGTPAEALERARERVAALPGAGEGGVRTLAVPEAEADVGALEAATFVPVPPGIGVRGAGAGPDAAAARARAWDALLAALGAQPRA
jgi:hypothetical protein